MNTLVSINDLRVFFGKVDALKGINLELEKGAKLGLVGESGSGKSTLGLSILGLLPKSAGQSGDVLFEGAKLPWGSDAEMTAIRGTKIGFVHQDPMSSFSPVHTIGKHLMRAHRAANPGTSASDSKKAILDLLDEVEITNAKERLGHYPHEYSGGMRQRVMIAASLVGNPMLLIADEATTALDVTTQAAVLKMMNRVVSARNMSLIFITHDLGVVAETCEDVAVMFGGKLIQKISVNALDTDAHPYTQALLKARPRFGMRGKRLPTIADMLPEGWENHA